MAKISSEGKIPKRIDDMVTYRLYDDNILRKKSGFTSKGMKKDPKYARSRENASEFGNVSRLCKNIRIGIKEVLPKRNNLEVCNGLTTVMRRVMCCDEIADSDERGLKNGFESAAGRALFTGYDFNPSGVFRAVFKGNSCFDIVSRTLVFDPFEVDEAFVFPEGANCVGLRMGALRFDFGSSECIFVLSDWSMYSLDSSVAEGTQLGIEDFPDGEGVLFYLLDLSFFTEEVGSFIPYPKDSTKVVCVLGVF